MNTPLYIHAYRELNRIMVSHEVINTLGIINKEDIDFLHERVNLKIAKYPGRKELIDNFALNILVAMVKRNMQIYEPPTKEDYTYKTLYDFLKVKLSDKEPRLVMQVAKAIMRLDKFYKKHHSYLEETIETKQYIN